jgi:hypothetical protein
MNYSIAFFIPLTKTIKGIDNIFMLLYPLIIFYYMVKNYKNNKLSYFDKIKILFLHIAFISVLIILIGLWNPANMIMNSTEEKLGVIRISLIYGVVVFILGLGIANFIKQKK